MPLHHSAAGPLRPKRPEIILDAGALQLLYNLRWQASRLAQLQTYVPPNLIGRPFKRRFSLSCFNIRSTRMPFPIKPKLYYSVVWRSKIRSEERRVGKEC